MSDLLNSASLVLIPSGYKEDTVYSVVPSDGSGDLSFTRASNGTRINSAGLVEVCPWNLTSYSEDFSNAAWTKNNCTVTANNTTAPNGTNTADLITSTSTSETGVYYFPSVIGTNTWSIYAKKGTGRYLFFNTNNPPNIAAKFDLEDGVIVGTPLAGATPSIESVGNGWYRCIITSNTAENRFTVFITNNTTTNDLTSSVGLSYYIWGAQLNIGSTAKPYFPTTDRLNVPRLTYQNGGGGCPSLLLEKQSTNNVLYSEDFSQANWAKTSAGTGSLPVVTTNYATSPDGTQNADLVVFDRGAGNTSSDFSWLYQNFVTASATYTMSCYVKAATSADVGKNLSWRNFGSGSAWDVTLTNEWQRVTVQETGTGSSAEVGFYNRGGYSTGNSVSVLMWGFQAEQSSYPTSYIPTTTASATRVADVMSVNLPNTDMTFCAYLELEEPTLGTTSGDWFSIYSSISPFGRAYGYDSYIGFADAYNLPSGSTVNNTKFVWKQESGSTAKVFVDGVLRATSTSGTYTDPFNRFQILGSELKKPLKIKQFVFFQNNLTDAECIELTTV